MVKKGQKHQDKIRLRPIDMHDYTAGCSQGSRKQIRKHYLINAWPVSRVLIHQSDKRQKGMKVRKGDEGKKGESEARRKERGADRGGEFFFLFFNDRVAALSRGHLVKYGLPFNCLHSDMWHILTIPHKIRCPQQFVSSFLFPFSYLWGNPLIFNETTGLLVSFLQLDTWQGSLYMLSLYAQ